MVDDPTDSRDIAFDGKDGSMLREWARERLGELHTEPARRLGASRREYMEEFFRRFREEIGPDGTR